METNTTTPDYCPVCYQLTMYPHFHPGIEPFWYCLNCHNEIPVAKYEQLHVLEEVAELTPKPVA